MKAKKKKTEAKEERKPLPSITIDLLAKYQDELKKAFGEHESIAYRQVSFTQLSIARHFGCAKVNGKMFVYNGVDDSLIREDVVKWMAKRLKAAKANPVASKSVKHRLKVQLKEDKRDG